MISLRCIILSRLSWFSISSFRCLPSFSSVLIPQPMVAVGGDVAYDYYGADVSQCFRIGRPKRKSGSGCQQKLNDRTTTISRCSTTGSANRAVLGNWGRDGVCLARRRRRRRLLQGAKGPYVWGGSPVITKRASMATAYRVVGKRMKGWSAKSEGVAGV